MSIQKRTVFYDNTDGIARFWDWAQVTTTLGKMSEPFLPNNRHDLNHDFEQYDPTDEIVRIDEVRALPHDQNQVILSGDPDGAHLMGGHCLPRNGP